MRKQVLVLMLLLFGSIVRMYASIDYISEALDLSQLESGSSTEVVMRAAGNSASDASYGFVWYRSSGSLRFLIDQTTQSKDALKTKSDATAYTFVLEKTSDGRIRIRENVTGGYMPYYSDTARGGFSSIGASDTRAGYFSYSSASSAANTLDANPAYILTSTLENGLPVNKSGDEFQVGGSSVGLSIQFFRYYSASEYEQLQANLPALYTTAALQTLKSALQSTTNSEADKEAAIAAFYASANGKEITLQNHHDYGGQGAEFMYASGTDLSTAVAPDASKAIFAVESVEGSNYRLKNLATGLYVAATPNRSSRITANKPQAEAGQYVFSYYPNATDHFTLDCTNSTSGDAYVSLHRDGSHRIVTWAANAAASQWTIEAAKTLNVSYTSDTDVALPESSTIYYLSDAQVITPPAIDGYDVTPESAIASQGDVTFHYTLKNYTITYNYYVLGGNESDPHHTKTYTGFHFGDALPTPEHQHAGMKLVKVPEGTVVGDREYRIYCTNDNYEPTPDPELPATVDITYTYCRGDKVVRTGAKRTVANGANMPELDPLPEFVSCAAPRGTVHYYEDQVIPLQVTYTLPFKSHDSFAEIDEWCNVAIAASKLLFNYNASDASMALSESGTKKEGKYLFAFVGNPFDGYIIYNKEAGENKVLSSPAVRPTTNTGAEDYIIMRDKPLAQGCNEKWDFKSYGSDGYLLSRHGDDAVWYANNRNGKLAYWADKNADGTSKYDGGSKVYISPLDLTLGLTAMQSAIPTCATPTDGSIYRIYSGLNEPATRGWMVSERRPTGEQTTTNGQMYLTNQKTVRDRSQMWMAVEQNAETHAFQLINLESGRYMQVGGSTNENAVSVYLLKTALDNYGICRDAAGSRGLNTNANRPVTDWGWTQDGSNNLGSNWVFEEVEYGANDEFTKVQLADRVRGFSPYARLASGHYYRLKNDNHTSLYMAENFLGDQKVRAVAENAIANPYAAVWKIEGDQAIGFTLTNALTTHVIATQTGWNAQYPTSDNAESAKRFFKVEDGGSTVVPPRYAFCPNDPTGESNPAWSLHCQAGGNVLNWNYTENGNLAAASFWRLEEVENMPSAEVLAQTYQQILSANQEAAEINDRRAELSEKIAAYFEDAACSRLREQFRRLSDASLRVLMTDDDLPEAIQNIILSLKDGKWEAAKDKVYNEYVGKFRIADYAPYSDRNAWNSKLRISATCYLTNPTGITVTSGEVVYLFVGEEPKEGAVLNLEIVEDTNAGAAANLGDLHRGLNVFTASATGELFVNYKVADTEKYLERAQDLNGVWHEPDYLPIKIHIEGGTANGYWDLSRNMTEEDWQWLSNNMLFSDFIHIKGHNTLLCMLTKNARYRENIVKEMKIYDFIYLDELKYIGHDGQWDGRYKPSVTVRDSYSGLFWNGNCANLAGLGLWYKDYINAGYWGTCHEIAHGIQGVFNLAGLTEVTNNALVQMINHDFGVKSSRGISVQALLEYKNNGDTWIDILRSSNATWATNHLFFQLYLYFEHLGHMPGFMGRVCDKIREWGGIHQHVSNQVMRYDDDYLMFARACAEVSQTDLSEFFDAWGFFGYSEDNHSRHDQDRASDHIYYIGDYGSVSLRQPSRNDEADRQYVEELKAQMKAYEKKAPGILFLNDRLKHDDWKVSADCFAATIDPSVVGKTVGYIDTWEEGDFGMFYDFTGRNEADALDYSISGNTITVAGDGLVGVKIYDAEGNLTYVANKREFTIPEEIASALADGTYTLVAALSNDTNLPLAKPGAAKHKMVVYNGKADEAQTYLVTGEATSESAKKVPYLTYDNTTTDVPALTGNAMVLLPEDADYFALPAGLKQSNVFTKSTYEGRELWMANAVSLTDKHDFYLPEGDYLAGTTSYSRQGTAGLNSVCLPFDTRASMYGNDAKTYVLKEVSESTITFTETTEVIPAGTFCLVDQGESDAAWQLGGTETSLIGSPLAGADAASVGSFQNAAIGAGKYKLNSAGTAFGITTDAGKVTAFRGYLSLPEAGDTRQLALSLVEAEQTTGVHGIESHSAATALDLQGRSTLTLERGKTYVINGKKIIVK